MSTDRFKNATEGYVAYKSGFKYQLAQAVFCRTGIRIPKRIETDFIVMEMNGDLWLAQWYAWDGPSGPTWDTPNSMRASALHDAGYQIEREGLLPMMPYRKRFDKLFYKALRADGMSHIRAWLWVKGVRAFAKSAADPKNLKPVLYAPITKKG